MGAIQQLAWKALGITSDMKSRAGKAGAAARAAKRQREEAREKLGMFGDLIKFQNAYAKGEAERRKASFDEFVSMQQMADDAFEDGMKRAQATTPGQSPLIPDLTDLTPAEYAQFQFIDMARMYLPGMLEGKQQQAAPPDQLAQVTESQHTLSHVNVILQRMGVDLTQLDPTKITQEHAAKFKELFDEVKL